MRTGKIGFLFVLAALAFIFSSTTAKADLYWESEIVTTGIPNQPDGTKIVKHYFTTDASRTDLGDGKIAITDFNTLDMVHLDMASKTYMRMNLNEMPVPPMGKTGQMKIQVEPTKETKTIGGYNCTKYDVTMMTMKSEFWVSKDVKGYEEMKSMGAKMSAAMDKNPMLAQMDISGMINKLDGFPVQITNHIMNGTSVTTLKTIQQKKLDPELFKVPTDFTPKKM